MVARKIRKSKSSRAGLLFPVTKVRNFLKIFHRNSKMRISEGASVYAAAVLEYLTAELLELSGNACKALHKKRMLPRHLMLAVQNDLELEKLLRHVTIPQAGVVPHVWPALVPSKAKGKGAAAAAAAAPGAPAAVAGGGGGSRQAAARPVAGITTGGLAPKSKKPAAAAAAAAAQRKQKGATAAAAAARAAPAANAAARPKQIVTIINERQLPHKQKVTVVKGDISTIQTIAIVHPTSSSYPSGGQVGSAIMRRGGQQMRQQLQQLQQQGSLPYCQAKECSAIGLGADWVINCNGPSWNSGSAATLVDDLDKTVHSCLTLANDKGYASIALPNIGSGSAGFPKHTAAQTILQTIRSFFDEHTTSPVKQVFFVLFDQESLDVYTSELAKMDL